MMAVFMTIVFMIPVLFYGYLFMIIFMFMFMIMMIYSFWGLNFFCNLSYFFGVDLYSFLMVLLTIWILMLMFLNSFKNLGDNYYMILLLFICLFLILSFFSSSLFFFFFFFECTLIPTIILIFGWGFQPERLSAGFYLFFYTMFGSLPLLIMVLFIFNMGFTLYFNLIYLSSNFFMYMAMILAFLIKMPMVFVHFWLPSAHVEAPITGSMVLAGVLLKLGGYGLIRVFNFMYFNMDWSIFLTGLVIYGGLICSILCFYQIDLKLLIAYSSVVHMSMVLCGILTLTFSGVMGSLILMIGHGLCSSGLFCLANIIYLRTSSRSLMINKGFINYLPSLSLFWFFLCINNMASPFSLNFLGELMLIMSLISWSYFMSLYLGLISFMSCGYSLYIYCYTQHGNLYSGIKQFSFIKFCDYLLIFYHLIPLNFYFIDIFI